WLGEKLQAAWQWFKNLIAPVKATQDTLNRCRDTGVMFGQALAMCFSAFVAFHQSPVSAT
ncbi:hypothetical protein MJN47_28445, partial [Salmonella enterica subsp. enterica serovar Lubbock]|nr:hypothetical protein [Salmonella enterica subsp. enterica serovar Lubbock]